MPEHTNVTVVVFKTAKVTGKDNKTGQGAMGPISPNSRCFCCHVEPGKQRHSDTLFTTAAGRGMVELGQGISLFRQSGCVGNTLRPRLLFTFSRHALARTLGALGRPAPSKPVCVQLLGRWIRIRNEAARMVLPFCSVCTAAPFPGPRG